MMINDLGKTFGQATLTNADKQERRQLRGVVEARRCGKTTKGCVAQLSKSFTGSLEHPKISESGRKFLAGLLAQLTDQQLRDLVRGRRVSPSAIRSVTVDDWVRVFKQKRDEIANAQLRESGALTEFVRRSRIACRARP